MWCGEILIGCGALKELNTEEAEIKSMRTATKYRGQGVATLVLQHLLSVAIRREYQSIYLETGSMKEFEPARALYLKHGFEFCMPFDGYVEDVNSVFMKKQLFAEDDSSVN